MILSESRKSQDKPPSLKFKAGVLVLAIIAVFLSGMYHPPAQHQPVQKVSVTPLVVGTVNLTVTRCGNDVCEPWESYYDCPQDCPRPWVLFVEPTPRNEFIPYNWVYVNVTLNNTADTAYLEWNSVNVTMGGSGLNFYRNMTGLANGNYTFLVWANMTTGWNSSEKRWVYVNYTPPTPEEEPPRRGLVSAGPALPPVLGRTVEVPVSAAIEEEKPLISILNVTVSFSGFVAYVPRIETRTVECGLHEDVIYVFEHPYQCLDVSTNIRASDMNNATVRFRVSNSWISQNNINTSTIKLVRSLDGNRRQDLLTWEVDRDGEYTYFHALTYGFSVFMILGRPITPTREIIPLPYCNDMVCDLSIGEGCETCPEDCGCPLGEACVRNTCIPEFYLWSMQLYLLGKGLLEGSHMLANSLVKEMGEVSVKFERLTQSSLWLPILFYIISILIVIVVAITLYRRFRREKRIEKLLEEARKRKLSRKRKGEYGSQIFPKD